MTSVSGTEGYADEADDLFRRYEDSSFAEVHRSVLHLLPAAPCWVLDIGSGTGRDAAALAAMGHRVVAVEPTAEMRTRAAALHPSPQIEWLDDSLPDLRHALSLGKQFDAVMMTAVWMHLDQQQRRRAMPGVASLVRAGGVMMMSLRHGPVPPGRRMFAVSADETIGLAQAAGLQRLMNQSAPSARAPEISWTRLAFRKADASR
jgi:SAM-dependent methyltransferase